jgi:hypothetical protein
MKLAELILFAALFAVPLLLLLRAWRRYVALDGSLGSGSLPRDIFQMRAGIALTSLTTFLWVTVIAVMVAADYSAGARSIAQNLSPGKVGLVNAGLCVGALLCSVVGLRRAHETVRLRGAIGVSCGCLMLMWLFLAANPH